MAKRSKKPKYFDQRVIRLLTRECVANELGPEVCWLITVIVLQERVVNFSRPVTYFNAQLMPLVGAGSEKTLKRWRDKAVKAGWLDYEKGDQQSPGLYSVKVPESLRSAWDGPISEAGSWEGCEDLGHRQNDGSYDGVDGGSNADQTTVEPTVQVSTLHRNKKGAVAQQPVKQKPSIPIPRISFSPRTQQLSGLTEEYLDALSERYPTVTVSFQVERMSRWFSNKFVEGWREPEDGSFNYHGFIVNWLYNEQQFGGQSGKRELAGLSRKIARRTRVG